MSGPIIDGCAGPGGWDIAAEALGIRPLGIELDDAACATREAAGLWTLQADVSAVDPREVMREHFDGEQLWGEIFSPPCPSFSMAGKGEGRAVIPLYQDAMVRIAVECKSVDRDELDEICGDPRAHLILEPLRWALALRPQWVALEQVEPCLPLWETTAMCLRHHGYRTWTGVLSSERYGVPQTRRRAILLASLERQPVMPAPSHQRYVPPRKVEEATESLFDVPEPERIVVPEDRGLLPWISMAEALGWGMTARPYPVIAGGTGGGPDLEKVGGSEARAQLYAEQAAGRWAGTFRPNGSLTKSGKHADGAWEPERGSAVRFRATNDRPRATVRDADSPAPALAFGHNPPRWLIDTGNTRGEGEVSSASDRIRDADEPAPTVTSRADQMEWRDEPTHYDSRGQRDGRTREPNRQRSVDEPAPTIAGESRNDAWVRERPATTVAGDPRVHPPGHKVNGDDLAAGRDGYEERRGENAIRVSLPEALVLQSFPPDYPIQGNKTMQFRQVGDAVPPGLAFAVLEEAIR